MDTVLPTLRGVDVQIEELVSVSGPDRHIAALTRHLLFPFNARVGAKVHFEAPRFIRAIGQPSTIGREPRILLVKIFCQERDGLAFRLLNV